MIVLALVLTASPLRVGVAGSPPFHLADADPPNGASVLLWAEIAKQLELPYALTRYPSVAKALEAVRAGEIDIAVGPITITAERDAVLDFTQPYFTTTLGILAPMAKRSSWDQVRGMISGAAVIGLSSLMLMLFGVGLVIWLAERRANSQHFPLGFRAGIGEGMWFALVTMTTVGYGDRFPITRLGRLVAGVWMMVAMLFVSSLTASIATALTLSQLETGGITGMDSLRDRRIASVDGSPGALLSRKYSSRLVSSKNLNDAIVHLLNAEADAVVFDVPQLEYYLAQHNESPLAIIDTHQEKQQYGFALPVGSDLRRRINPVMLQLLESGKIEAMLARWIPGKPSEAK